MPSHGIIYQAHSRLKKFVYRVARGFGAGVFTYSIVAIVFTFYPVFRDEFLVKPQKIGFGDIMQKTKAKDRGLDPYFSIYIPKMNALANIIPNVNATSPDNYLDALKDGVAHAEGTGFPGQNKLIYLFSHSTDSPLNFARYNAVFYLLRKLEDGDRIIVYFMNQEYQYVVKSKHVVSAKDTSWIKDNGEGEYLVLQTCDPPGTTLKRLVVIAKPAY